MIFAFKTSTAVFLLVALISSLQLPVVVEAGWTQLGTEIVGNGGDFGKFVAMSQSGTTIVACAPGVSRVAVYEINTANQYVISGPNTVVANQYEQYVSNIAAPSASSSFGQSVTMSDDGATIGVGGAFAAITMYAADVTTNDATCPNSVPTQPVADIISRTGGFSVHKRNTDLILKTESGQLNTRSGQFSQLGSEIVSSQSGDDFGLSLAMSADASMIAVGAYNSFQNCFKGAGLVRLYQRNQANQYEPIDKELNGAASNAYFGYALAMSSDGRTIAVASPSHSGIAGRVSVFKFNSCNQLIRFGEDIMLDAETTESIHISISMSANGAMIAVGSPYAISNKGVVDVYALKTIEDITEISENNCANTRTGSLVQIGTSITGSEAGAGLFVPIGSGITGIEGSLFGFSVAMSEDGKIIAVGAPGKDSVSIYKVNPTSTEVIQELGEPINTEITQKGETIFGPPGSAYGTSVAISGDGATIVVGAPRSTMEGVSAVLAQNANGVVFETTSVGEVRIHTFLEETTAPTKTPTKAPTKAPTKMPTKAPTNAPTKAPTNAPTKMPTKAPTNAPTKAPTNAPTKMPTKAPTKMPTKAPTKAPTKVPTKAPTKAPTRRPTKAPTDSPSQRPSAHPIEAPVKVPVFIPVLIPVIVPVPVLPVVPVNVLVPVVVPLPVRAPTKAPTKAPDKAPTKAPTNAPMKAPVKTRTNLPSKTPTTSSLTESPVNPPTNCGLLGYNFICFGPDECGFFRRLFNIGGC